MNSTVDWSRYEAVLFDLDGVITPTADVHEDAWGELFSEEFDYTDQDYLDLIDGKPRLKGVSSFLESRGVFVDDGDPSDEPAAKTLWGYGNKKNAIFHRMIDESGITAYPGTVRLLDHLDNIGVRYAIVSSSRNAAKVLAASGLSPRFDIVVDGNTTADHGLRGKPAPDSYLLGAQLLDAEPSHTVVIEDAVSGVEAGAAGNFSLVIGVDRGAGRDALDAAGADLVVGDLAETLSPAGRRLKPTPTGMDRDRFREHPWQLIETRFDPEDLSVTETLFGLGNGFLGMRADAPEDGDTTSNGTFLNGYHETWPIKHAEDAYGFARTGQTIVNVPDTKEIVLHVDGEEFSLRDISVQEYERRLDFRSGELERTVRWTTAAGVNVDVTSTRMVSFVDRNLVMMQVEVAVDKPVAVSFTSKIINTLDGTPSEVVDGPDLEGIDGDPRVATAVEGRVLEPELQRKSGTGATICFRTVASRLPVACGVEHQVASTATVTVTNSVEEDTARYTAEATLEAGQSLRLTKFVAYHSGSEGATAAELASDCEQTLSDAVAAGAAQLRAGQAGWLSDFWARSDIAISGAVADQQALRWNLFQLAQASGTIQEQSIPAKGVSAGGYDGHYFWDTEVYVVPFLSYTSPELAKQVLLYRWNTLDNARTRASEMSQKGALYAWRTINGDECSAYYPAGTAQYHINADVAFALERYVTASGDSKFLASHGAEILIETARLWSDLGFFGSDGEFHLHRVTGPDEYSAVVNDNTYTNVMARAHLRFAADATATLADQHPAVYAELAARIGLDDDEIDGWRNAAQAMHIPLVEDQQMHAQDAGFLDLAPWPWLSTPDDKYPLLLNFHPLVIYRHQVLKQTDVVLASLLRPDAFTHEQLQNNFDYYDAINTGDSSLSAGSQAGAAARAGRPDLAWHHFRHALYLDLCNTHANTSHGVHIASAGGVWTAVLAGFLGFSDDGTTVTLDPAVPAELGEVTVNLVLRGVRVKVTAQGDQCSVNVVGKGAVIVVVNGSAPVAVTEASPVS